MRYAEIAELRQTLPGIRSRAGRYDQTGNWPADDLRVLANQGAMRWAVPMGQGGEDLSALELHFRYEAVAAASLSTALILTQRDSAIGLLSASANRTLADELLPALANDALFATVGIAQLTTSRQGGRPALRATRVEGGFRLDGIVPWSTGADHSRYVVVGAVDEAGLQLLLALPTDLPGVKVDPPMPLVGLRSTHTAAVRCDGVMLDDRHVLAGPVQRVLGDRPKSLPIGQVFLAMGHCRGALQLIGEHTSERARTTREQFEAQLDDLRRRVLDFCSPTSSADPAAGACLRGECNELALRITHAAVALYKGSSLLPDHPAQRLAREALFLLVWSCPDPVIDCTVELLTEG